MLEYQKIRKKNRLTDTAIDLLHLINEFRKLHKLKNEVTLHFVNDQLQMIEKKHVWNVSTVLLCKFI